MMHDIGPGGFGPGPGGPHFGGPWRPWFSMRNRGYVQGSIGILKGFLKALIIIIIALAAVGQFFNIAAFVGYIISSLFA